MSKEIKTKKANELANLVEKARATKSCYYDEAMQILELGNRWTMYLSKLERLLFDYYDARKVRKSDRAALVANLLKIFEDYKVEFNEHTEKSIYLHEFECEHDEDMEVEKEDLLSAGAIIVKTKCDECEETGYIFFSVPVANVERFEKEFGRLWKFRKAA